MSVVVKQLGDREWAVSLRSKGAVDVSRVAVALGGGGHRLAAGFTEAIWPGTGGTDLEPAHHRPSPAPTPVQWRPAPLRTQDIERILDL